MSHKTLPLAVLSFVALLAGCGGSAHIPAATASGPQLYMTPTISGGYSSSATAKPATYSVDDKAQPLPTFVQDTYAFSDKQSGAQIQYSGNVVTLSRGLRELELTYACGSTTVTGCTGIHYNSLQPASGWAVELADQSGGLVQLTGQPFAPLVPAVTCPSMKSAETFLFVTLPARLTAASPVRNTWNAQHETAYGSVDISASGSTVNLAKINQYILPSEGGGTPANAPSTSVTVTGACSPTVYGETVAVPANPTTTITGGVTQTTDPQAMMGIGPSGLLVEDNGTFAQNSAPYYENTLGAGTGAIGLPVPSSTIDPPRTGQSDSFTASVVGAQYLGFLYGSGSSGSSTNGFSSVASFGFPTLPSSCKTLMAQIAAKTATSLVNPIYGGDFPVNTTTGLPDPSLPSVQTNGGYGNCDFVVDLGLQSSTTNGLYEGATVWVGASTATNTSTANAYSIPAVAIAGTLNGKYAIFLIGEDTVGSPNQAWGIYLLQSN